MQLGKKKAKPNAMLEELKKQNVIEQEHVDEIPKESVTEQELD
jgi:hypothetical protein